MTKIKTKEELAISHIGKVLCCVNRNFYTIFVRQLLRIVDCWHRHLITGGKSYKVLSRYRPCAIEMPKPGFKTITIKEHVFDRYHELYKKAKMKGGWQRAQAFPALSLQ